MDCNSPAKIPQCLTETGGRRLGGKALSKGPVFSVGVHQLRWGPPSGRDTRDIETSKDFNGMIGGPYQRLYEVCLEKLL